MLSLTQALQYRAECYQKIRDFFAKKGVLEVETPLLSTFTVTDPYIQSFQIKKFDYYLQTSPEYAMKRLLVAGSGSIYQLCKAFREEQLGHKHNPEFTLLEWYRIGFDHHLLMDEMDEMLQTLLDSRPAERLTYQELFLRYLSIDVFYSDEKKIKSLCENEVAIEKNNLHDQDTALQLLFSHCIEPQLGFEAPVFVYDFPASQAALSKIRQSNPPVAERFEVYINGTELANGFHELADAKEQYQRFFQNQQERKKLNLPVVEIDTRFISALESGFPACAGVALGIDRLLMIKAKASSIEEVIAFTWDKA